MLKIIKKMVKIYEKSLKNKNFERSIFNLSIFLSTSPNFLKKLLSTAELY